MQLPCEFLLFKKSVASQPSRQPSTRLPAPAVHSPTHSDQLHLINLATGLSCHYSIQLLYIVLNPVPESLLLMRSNSRRLWSLSLTLSSPLLTGRGHGHR